MRAVSVRKICLRMLARLSSLAGNAKVQVSPLISFSGTRKINKFQKATACRMRNERDEIKMIL